MQCFQVDVVEGMMQLKGQGDMPRKKHSLPTPQVQNIAISPHAH